jgi:hypothetical protein
MNRSFLTLVCLFIAAVELPAIAAADKADDFERRLERRISYIGNTNIIRYGYFEPSSVKQVVWDHILFDKKKGPFLNHIQNHDSFFGFSMGKRFGPGDISDFRWRIKFLEENKYTERWTTKTMFIDYDKTGVADLDARWINLSLGPALTFGGRAFALETRLTGSVGLGSIQLGKTNFPELGPDVDKRQSYKETGFSVSTALRFTQTFLLSAYYGERNLHTDIKTRFTTIGIQALLWLKKIGNQSVKLMVNLEREEAEFDDLSQDSEYLKVGVRINQVREDKEDETST